MENMILQPIVVGGQTFKNRIMFPPLTTGYEKNGMISEQDMGFTPPGKGRRGLHRSGRRGTHQQLFSHPQAV